MPEQERRPRRQRPGTPDQADTGTSGDETPVRSGSARIRLDSVPATLRWAVWLLAAEAAGLVAIAGVLGYDAATATSQSATSAVAIVVFTLLVAAIVGWLSVSLARRRRWARGPAVVVQLLLLPIGYSVATNGIAAVGILMIVIGLAGVATLLAPATRAALESR
jgi:hypothetical protein